MPSSSFDCVKKSDVDKLGKVIAQYQRMSKAGTVRKAARGAGGTLCNNMASMIKGEPTLRDYHSLADSLRVWQDEGNVHVGLHPDHPMIQQAEAMHQNFPVSDAAMDLAKQSGEIEDEFIARLQNESRAWYQKFLGMRGALG